ncbi:hypothetical protein BXO88_12135 [Oribacterium sp. C9]|uniref:helix-turn-helix domain-containing protein n=1 Tax=Oribacterium sp. C9 TaxID=1943579 RepID=UPI000990134B|nr:helix-turn-helix domain-containing protein [Oribacterium sp. C9]OON85530.1 hypothetical protein BXO88_12135 [Oribacterium sp. C9]
MINIKELRNMSGLTQAGFAAKYHIPLQTVKQWEAAKDTRSHRTPPEYVLRLLELAVLRDIEDHMVSLLTQKSKTTTKKSNKELLIVSKNIW